MREYFHDFLAFVSKQAYACIFGLYLVILLVVTKYYYPLDDILYRYDFLLISAIIFQIFLITTRLESWREVGVIVIFHIVATGMEVFKTHPSIGSWQYPGEFSIGILGVPLFAGFMYSAVGSYIARVWRIFEFRFENYPKKIYTILIALAIYVNFFTHHFIWDFRYMILIGVFLTFGRTRIYFKPRDTYYSMNLALGFSLVGLFIWFGENIGTFTQTWVYPTSIYAGFVVSPQKILAWFLLMIISFVLVSLIHQPKEYRASQSL
jgi:uncharacterized membrane protein YoaT (DUF817 family)